MATVEPTKYDNTIAGQIERLQKAKSDLKTAIKSKGVTVPDNTLLSDYAQKVNLIEQGGGGGSDNTWWFCSEYRRFSFIKINGYWIPWGSILRIYMEYANVWFEYNGEKYYVDSISDGTHTLTKQGVAVPCNIGNFVQLKITQQGDTYNVFMEEN